MDVRADDEPGMDIDHHVAVEILAPDRAGELGDIPGEHLPRGGRDQFRNRPGRLFGQPAALLDLAVFLKHPVKSRQGTQINPIIEQLRVDLHGSQIHELR